MKRARILPFLKEALSNPKRVGTIFPSSRWTARAVAKWVPDHTRTLIEYGSGNGSITRELLRSMPKKSKLIGIEMAADFITDLRKIQDKRLHLVHGNVLLHVKHYKKLAPRGASVVVSGIPFSFLKKAQLNELIRLTQKLLVKNGRFIVYQHTLRALPFLQHYFERVSLAFEPRNIIPYFIMVAEK